jgi:lysozyme
VNLTKLMTALRNEEGVKPKVYLDSKGIPTVGVGRNLRDKGLSQDEINYLLVNDINECVADLMTLPWFKGLDDVRQRVLVDMRFNLGPTKFREFKKLIQALEHKDYYLSSKEMLDSTWAQDVKGRAIKLARMMETGTDA